MWSLQIRVDEVETAALACLVKVCHSLNYEQTSAAIRNIFAVARMEEEYKMRIGQFLSLSHYLLC